METSKMIKAIQKMASEHARDSRITRAFGASAEGVNKHDVRMHRYDAMRMQASSANLYRIAREELGIEE